MDEDQVKKEKDSYGDHVLNRIKKHSPEYIHEENGKSVMITKFGDEIPIIRDLKK